MKNCAKCGYKNEVEAKVCNLCGERLPAVAAADESAEPHPLLPKSQTRALPNKAAVVQTPATPTKRSSLERHLLVPPFGEAFALEPGEAFTIGREPASSLRLTTVKASRQHAEVVWRETGPAIRDLGSQNGTWVNDRQLPPRAEALLKEGDTIQIGDLIVAYRRVAPGVPEAVVSEAVASAPTTRTPSLKARQARAEDANLEGDASTFPIMDVLTKIAERGASGVLTVEVEGAKGEMHLVEGKAVSARYPGIDGTIAIQVIASLKSGRFRFQAHPRKEPETGKYATLRAASGQAPAT